MPDLINTINAVGTVDSVSTALTGVITIQTIEGLTLEKTADKLSWADGYLTYTVTITNAAGNSTYTAVQLTDVLDSTTSLVDDSIIIDGVPAASTDYSYDSGTNTLTMGIDAGNPIDVAAGASVTITFQVQKV